MEEAQPRAHEGAQGVELATDECQFGVWLRWRPHRLARLAVGVTEGERKSRSEPIELRHVVVGAALHDSQHRQARAASSRERLLLPKEAHAHLERRSMMAELDNRGSKGKRARHRRRPHSGDR